MIDTERLGTLSAELAQVQEQITERQERRHAIVRELVELLNESAGGAEPEAAVVPPGGAPPVLDTPSAGQGAPDTSPPSATYPCPDCDRTFRTPAARGSHARTHFDAAVRKHRSESFLCSNNCGRSFPTKDRLRLHENGTCQPQQTRPPTAEGFRIKGQAPALAGDGFGQ